MAYIKTSDFVGQTVKLTKEKTSLSGYFEIGTIVKITDCDQMRGYTFEDEKGNRVIEAGFDGFELVE